MVCPNEVHDVLFSKARVVLNNNVKRLWFKINPFLERKDTLKGFSQPEQLSKFVKLLQSSVGCEQYFSDELTTFHDVTIEEFWDFLYSDKWSHGCSIRILEGQLLDYLITALYVLEKTNIIGHHNTFAFARNQRERRACYKLSNEEKGCRIIEETLLLEFTYYGRKTEKKSKDTPSTTTETTTESTFHTIKEVEEESDEIATMQILSRSRKRKQSIFRYNFDPYSSHSFKRNSMFISSDNKEEMNDISRRLEYMVKTGCVKNNRDDIDNTLRNWKEHESGNNEDTMSEKTAAGNASDKPNVEIIPQILRADKKSNQTSPDNKDKLKARPLNLAKFACTDKDVYGDGLDVQVVDDVNTLENVDTGEEFYLGENIIKTLTDDINVQEKLRTKLKDKQKMREEKKAIEVDWQKHHQGLPKYKEIDFSLYTNMKKIQKIPQRVPTFEEFLNTLEEEEKYDPRFRRAKQMSKKVAKRYNIEREALKTKISDIPLAEESSPEDDIKLPPIGIKQGQLKYRQNTIGFAEEVGGVTDSKACERWVIDQQQTFRKRAPSRRFTAVSDEDERERSVSFEYESTLYDFDLLRRESSVESDIPLVFLTSASGTLTELLHEEEQENVDNITPQITETKTTISTLSSPLILKNKLTSKKKSIKEAKSKKPPLLKKPLPKQLEVKSPETETDEEQEKELFDSKKLNLKYSFERLRGKQIRKKQPSFIEVLKKYYKIQKVVNKFTSQKKGGRRRGIFARLMKLPMDEHKDELQTIGTLKKFDFLQRKAPQLTQGENVSFASVSMLDFTANVLKALDDFVVRKEQVVSDYHSKTSMTITFTRKSVFKMKLA
ncbi:uncharacterized protein LOC127709581 [Mytilus californianus]|uniref:uncharacterized protein LOC127709581 n=1 Tax=Mytilus californianus TaxID=6549 RepID=UPI0022485E61|nr:uncharacterized protein LOC127709581 [Mytilus californianus]